MLSRNNSMGSGMPARGLSVRRPGGAAPPSLGAPGMAASAAMGMAGTGSTRTSPTGNNGGGPRKGESRLTTEFYDSYLDSYGGGAADEVPPLPEPRNSPDRVANWERNNASPVNGMGVQRQMSRSVPPSSYAPSSVGGTLRRKNTRRPVRAPTRSTYYGEEEEGYVSGEYDDGPFELMKIRVKASYHLTSVCSPV